MTGVNTHVQSYTMLWKSDHTSHFPASANLVNPQNTWGHNCQYTCNLQLLPIRVCPGHRLQSEQQADKSAAVQAHLNTTCDSKHGVAPAAAPSSLPPVWQSLVTCGNTSLLPPWACSSTCLPAAGVLHSPDRAASRLQSPAAACTSPQSLYTLWGPHSMQCFEPDPVNHSRWWRRQPLGLQRGSGLLLPPSTPGCGSCTCWAAGQYT